jgi:hypothetical protein
VRWTWVLIVLAAATGGCKLASEGLGPQDDGGGIDAVSDESVPDAAPDAASDADAAPDAGPVSCPSGLLCNGQCTQASDCTGCTGAPLLCAPLGMCTSDCTVCHDAQNKAMPIECFACDQNRANPQGTCQYDDQSQYCLSGNYAAASPAGGFRCLCDDAGAGACPGDTQVCAATPGGTNVCLTCGEVYLNDLTGQACKNGKTCSAAAHACQ